MVILSRQEVEPLFLYAGLSDTHNWSDALFLRRLKLMSLVVRDEDVPDELTGLLRTIRQADFLDLCLGTPGNGQGGSKSIPEKIRSKCNYPFSFAFAGIPVGSVLVLSSNPKITCTVVDGDTGVSFAEDVSGVDNTQSWTANTKSLLGYGSAMSLAPRRYWKYKNKVIDFYYQEAIKNANKAGS